MIVLKEVTLMSSLPPTHRMLNKLMLGSGVGGWGDVGRESY